MHSRQKALREFLLDQDGSIQNCLQAVFLPLGAPSQLLEFCWISDHCQSACHALKDLLCESPCEVSCCSHTLTAFLAVNLTSLFCKYQVITDCCRRIASSIYAIPSGNLAALMPKAKSSWLNNSVTRSLGGTFKKLKSFKGGGKNSHHNMYSGRCSSHDNDVFIVTTVIVS